MGGKGLSRSDSKGAVTKTWVASVLPSKIGTERQLWLCPADRSALPVSGAALCASVRLWGAGNVPA